MFKELAVQRLSLGTVYKLLAIGMTAFLVPFSLLMGIFAYFGAGTVTWNEQPLTGISGLLASPFLGLFGSALFTAIMGTWLAIGLWIYSKIRPLTIKVRLIHGETDA